MTDGMTTVPRRFSHSLVSTYLDCPRKAWFRYVETIPSPPAPALIIGSACDEAWNYALQTKLEIETDLGPCMVQDVAEQAFRDRVHAEGGVDAIDWGEDGSARKSLDSALRLADEWAVNLQPHIRPSAVQIEYHRPLPSGRDFVGFVDWEGTVDGAKVIGDNKTGKRRMASDKVDRELQPFAYGYLLDGPILFAYARAIDTGRNVSSEFVYTGRSREDAAWYGEILAGVERGFETGTFPANPGSFLCGRNCPYLERCMPHRTINGTQKA